ncbi:MAG: DUF6702 family protein [Saprospiraceae bacterium]
MFPVILTAIISLFYPGILTSTTSDHAIHISKCEIQLNETGPTLEIAAQVYLDDLQTVLTKYGFPDLHLCTDRESKIADSVLTLYFGKNLQIQADSKLLKPSFIGKEPSDDDIAVWCYFEMKIPATFKQLNVKYDVLMELYDDQKNIVNLKVRDKKSYMLLHAHHMEESVQY